MNWKDTILLELVKDTMSQMRNDYTEDGNGDKLHKLRPIIDSLPSKFLSLHKGRCCPLMSKYAL